MINRTYPLPANTGAKQRVAAFLTRLSRKHDVVIAALKEKDSKVDTLEEEKWGKIVFALRESGKSIYALKSLIMGITYHEARFWDANLSKAILETIRKDPFDVIWVNSLTMSRYLDSSHTHRYPASPSPLLLLDQQNLDELVWERHNTESQTLSRKLYTNYQLRLVKHLQQLYLPRYDIILSVSQDELNITKRYVTKRTQVWLAPNGVDTSYFKPTSDTIRKNGHPKIVFGAAMDTTMNQDAVVWFMKEIFPLIKTRKPEAEFWIVGRKPPDRIRKLAEDPSIKITGTVPDVRDYYGQADVFVVPLRMGGGTKLKTVEALAMALPVVSTDIGAQGLDVSDGQHLFIANRPAKFADRVLYCLDNPEQARVIGYNARSQVRKLYEWESIVSQVEDKLQELVALSKNPIYSQ